MLKKGTADILLGVTLQWTTTPTSGGGGGVAKLLGQLKLYIESFFKILRWSSGKSLSSTRNSYGFLVVLSLFQSLSVRSIFFLGGGGGEGWALIQSTFLLFLPIRWTVI